MNILFLHLHYFTRNKIHLHDLIFTQNLEFFNH